MGGALCVYRWDMEKVYAGAGGGAGHSRSSGGVIIYICAVNIDMLYQRMNERVCLYVRQVDSLHFTAAGGGRVQS
jgi:hypothetical protein